MKYLLFLLALSFSISSFAQSQYQVSIEGPDKILKGIISRESISSDTTFTWFSQNQKGYNPNVKTVQALKDKQSKIQLIAFGGTWCDDTKQIFPKFFSMIDAAGFPESRITLIGVDREKKTISHLAEALNVQNVPTFIVLQDGKELGRVVEYGKMGQWEKELGDIINLAQ